jgi:hypothetical protein
MQTDITRRHLFSLGAGAGVLALGGCASTTNPTTGVVTYGLDPAVITAITNVVQAVANYAPTIESIAATAAGLFGPAYSAIVVAGSAAVNAVIAALTNLLPSIPVGARMMLRRRRLGAAAVGTLRGYVKVPAANGGFSYIPVYAQ